MDTGLYVALSAQVATERRMATIADNIANINTSGFRETGIHFAELVSGPQSGKNSFVTPGVAWMSGSQGALVQTGGQLDFAINGEGWFLVQTPVGEAVTRDGRMSINADGTLANLDGYPVLDQGGAPVQVNLAAGPLKADGAGILYQNNSIVGSVGVFDYAGATEQQRMGSLSLVPEGATTPVEDSGEFSVQQGYVEASNVNAVQQITRLITVQRNFEENANLIQQSEASLNEAIRLLGGK